MSNSVNFAFDFRVENNSDKKILECHINLDVGWIPYSTFLQKFWNDIITEISQREIQENPMIFGIKILFQEHKLLCESLMKSNDPLACVFVSLAEESFNTLATTLKTSIIKAGKENRKRVARGEEWLSTIAVTTSTDLKLCCEVCKVVYSPETKPKKCSRCMMTTYCGADCQKLDWKKHKQICCQEFIKDHKLNK